MLWTHPEKAVSRQISDALVTQLPSSSLMQIFQGFLIKENRQRIIGWIQHRFICLHIAVSQIQKRKAVDVELYINDDKELFKSLFAHKDEIEKNMEMELEWKELPERKASRILIEKRLIWMTERHGRSSLIT